MQFHSTPLAMVLSTEGFLYDGKLTFRRLNNHVVSLLSVQQKADKAGFFVNMGVHLDFLPASPGNSIVAWNTLEEPQCEIRQRLNSHHDVVGLYWKHQDIESSALADAYQTTGKVFFTQFSQYPDAWIRCTIASLESEDFVADFPGITKVRVALMLARIHHHLGNKDQQNEFAEYGLSIAGKMAVGPRVALRALLVQ